MSEIPLPRNESQSWQRELPLHRELDGKLKPEETLALIGSHTKLGLEGLKQDREDGAISDYDFSMQQRTYTAALEQLSTLKIGEGTDVFHGIIDRQTELESALDGDVSSNPNRRAEEIKLWQQLSGVKLLNKVYMEIDDIIDSLAKTYGDFKRTNPRNRAAAINEVIKWHNQEVSGIGVDSPEIQEAQARIDDRYAEQKEQPEPTETVDEARQKVAEVFDDSGEKRLDALIGEVARAAKGATRIHTDIPKGLMLKSTSGDYRPMDGFNSFGDGLPQQSQHHVKKLAYGGSAEAFIFEPDTATHYRTATKTVEAGGRFWKKTEQVEEQIPDGEIPIMVTNPTTGEQEPSVKVAYQFNGNNRNENGQPVSYEGPQYVTVGGRGGNVLYVETTLPRSVAEKLKQEVVLNPNAAREFAKTLLLNNGITEQAWNNNVRPPFDKVPSDWAMSIVDLQKDTRFRDVRHKVVSRQVIETR